MTLPAPLEYGQVRWKAVQAVADTADGDALPEAVPVTGSVTFDLMAPALFVPGVDPTTVFVQSHTYWFDLTGVLRDVQGRELISLIATDSETVTPTGATWRASPHLTSGHRMEPFFFELPAGTVVDLTEVAPVLSSTGVPIIRGPKGDPGDPGPQGDPGPEGPAGGGWNAVDATETVKGIVELATTAEATAGTDTVRAVTPAGVKAHVDAATVTVADATTSTKGIVQLTNHLGGTATAPTVRNATDTVTGIVELATNAETITGTDTARAVTPAGVKAAAVQVTEAPLSALRHGVKSDGTDTTAELQAALNAVPDGGTLLIPDATFRVDSALTVPSNISVIGEGRRSQIDYRGSTAMATLSSKTNIKFEKLRVSLAHATGTAFDLSNSFRNSFRSMIVDGQHLSSTGSTYRTQRGFVFRDNAGDNRIIDCDINNLGNGISTDSIMNYVVGSVFGTCWKSIVGGDPAGVNFRAGISATSCTFVSSAAATDCHVDVTGSSLEWWFSQVWMEGCDTAVRVGSASGGARSFGLNQMKLAATTKILDIVNGRQFSLRDITLAGDGAGAATPIPITVNATTAQYGFVETLRTTQVFDYDTVAVFPQGWTVLGGRSSATQLPRLGTRTAAPTTGTWARGDIVWNSAPSASGFIGWVCVTAGTPGTWKTFGAISA